MVSGFFTSPYDQERIFSGEAIPILIASNSSSCVTCLNKSSSAFISYSCSRLSPTLGAHAPSVESALLESLQINVDPKRPDLLHQHVEGFRHPRVDLVVALDDVLVDLGAAVDVVGLDREHLLQRVGSAIGFERPHLHFAETLTAELRLASERLLRHETVRSRGARMHLVVDQVVQLQHMHETHGHLPVERVAGPAVVQSSLPPAR